VRFFFSNAPQFLAIPTGSANVPGFGADLAQDNRVLTFQDIHVFNPRMINEARVGYSFIRGNMSGQNPIKDSDLGIKRANANAYPGLGAIRIGPTATNAIAIGNSGANVDTQNVASATTLVDILTIVHGRHNVRAGAQFNLYRNELGANNNRRGTIAFRALTIFYWAWRTIRSMEMESEVAFCVQLITADLSRTIEGFGKTYSQSGFTLRVGFSLLTKKVACCRPLIQRSMYPGCRSTARVFPSGLPLVDSCRRET
jgi:hypothetical protein